MKPKSEKPITINVIIITGFFVAAFAIPIMINYALFLPFPPTPNGLGNKDWLSFWGSFLGGSVGGIATLFAVFYTLRQNLQHNRNIIEQQSQNTRLQVLPFIDVRVLRNRAQVIQLVRYLCQSCQSNRQDNDDQEINHDDMLTQFPSGYVVFERDKAQYSAILEEPYKRILDTGIEERSEERSDGTRVVNLVKTNTRKLTLSFCNIGIYSAIRFTMELTKSDNFSNYQFMPPSNIKVGEVVLLNFVFSSDFPLGENRFDIRFCDIYGNQYRQVFKIIDDEGKFSVTPISLPSLKDESA